MDMIFPGSEKLVAECQNCGEGAVTAAIFDILSSLGLTANLQLCIDAGDAACYSGAGTTVTNRGAGGVGLTIPAGAFKGTPGGKSGREYFESGARADRIQLASQPAWADPSRQNASFTLAAWVLPRAGGENYGLVNYLVGTSDTSWTEFSLTPDAVTLDCSMIFVGCYSAGGSQAYWSQTTAKTSLIKANCWNFVAVSIAEAVAGGSFFFANGQHVPITIAGAPYPSAVSPAQNAITADFIAGPAGSEINNYQAGITDGAGRKTRFAAWLHWATLSGAAAALNAAQLNAVYTATKARYGH